MNGPCLDGPVNRCRSTATFSGLFCFASPDKCLADLRFPSLRTTPYLRTGIRVVTLLGRKRLKVARRPRSHGNVQAGRVHSRPTVIIQFPSEPKQPDCSHTVCYNLNLNYSALSAEMYAGFVTRGMMRSSSALLSKIELKLKLKVTETFGRRK